MTRKQAESALVRSQLARQLRPTDYLTIPEALDALDRAGAFPSEATEAEIADVARQVFAADNSDFGEFSWRTLALRLASACRAAGFCGKVRP